VVGGKQHKAHRLTYELAKGAIPEGFHVDHLCEMTLCCNPDHLEAKLPEKNILRSSNPAAVNARKTHCINGHEFNGDNTYVRGDGSRSCRTCQREYMGNRRKENPLFK
jgi:hypothetical protein